MSLSPDILHGCRPRQGCCTGLKRNSSSFLTTELEILVKQMNMHNTDAFIYTAPEGFAGSPLSSHDKNWPLDEPDCRPLDGSSTRDLLSHSASATHLLPRSGM